MPGRRPSSQPDQAPLGDEALLDAVRNDLAQHGLAHDELVSEEPPSRYPSRATGSPVAEARSPVARGREAEDRGLPVRRRTNGSSRRRIQRSGSGTETAKGGGLKALLQPRPSGPSERRLSDATVSRLGATLLWVLVIVAAYGGVSAWLRPGSSAATETMPASPGEVADGRWAAAGFAERYVAAYLAAGSDGAGLAPYLGYSPDLPGNAEPASTTEPVRMVEVVRGHDERTDYWSVTVAVGEPDLTASDDGEADLTGGESGESGDQASDDADGAADSSDEAAPDEGEMPEESFWRVAVDTSGDQPVAAGLPAPVPGPPAPERADLALSLQQPPTDEPMVESVEGFLASYLCGAADLDRYVHPDYVHLRYETPAGGSAEDGSTADGQDALVPADPPVCQEVAVDRWADAPARDLPGVPPSEEDDERRTVVAEVSFDTGSDARQTTHALTLAERDGRWEVVALLPAPPIEER